VFLGGSFGSGSFSGGFLVLSVLAASMLGSGVVGVLVFKFCNDILVFELLFYVKVALVKLFFRMIFGVMCEFVFVDAS